MTYPKVMIATATKYDEKYLEAFLTALSTLDYPRDRIRLAVMIGNVEDAKIFRQNLSSKICSQFDMFLEQRIWRPRGVSLKADLYTDLVTCMKDEDYVLFIDSDVVSIPPNLLKHLITRNVDIIAPYVYNYHSKIFFDTYIFRKDGNKFSINPPFQEEVLEVDSVGTCLLVRSKVLKECRFANPHHWLHFCYFAREKGYKVYADPTIRIEHADISTEPLHLSFEAQVMSGYIDINECIKRGVMSLEDIHRYEKIIGVTLIKDDKASV
jgi:hypothetical protein